MVSGQGHVAAFVDWENVRLRLADNYMDKMLIDQVLLAIEKVAADIGRHV